MWDGKITHNDANIDPNIKGGIDPLLGLGLQYDLADHYSVQLKFQRVFFGGQDVDLWGGGLSCSFY